MGVQRIVLTSKFATRELPSVLTSNNKLQVQYSTRSHIHVQVVGTCASGSANKQGDTSQSAIVSLISTASEVSPHCEGICKSQKPELKWLLMSGMWPEGLNDGVQDAHLHLRLSCTTPPLPPLQPFFNEVDASELAFRATVLMP